MRAVFGAQSLDLIHREFIIAAKCFSQLVLGAKVYFAVCNTLNVNKMTGGYVVSSEILATRTAGEYH